MACTLTALSALHPTNATAALAPHTSLPAVHSVEAAAQLSAAATAAAEQAALVAAASHSCVMTHISLLAHRLTGSVPLLGLFCYVSQWLFLAVVTASACYESCRDKHALVADDDDGFFAPDSVSPRSSSSSAAVGHELSAFTDDGMA